MLRRRAIFYGEFVYRTDAVIRSNQKSTESERNLTPRFEHRHGKLKFKTPGDDCSFFSRYYFTINGIIYCKKTKVGIYIHYNVMGAGDLYALKSCLPMHNDFSMLRVKKCNKLLIDVFVFFFICIVNYCAIYRFGNMRSYRVNLFIKNV